jgi:DNA-binding protein YbaB
MGGNPMNMMGQLQSCRSRSNMMQDQLADETISSAGSGAVKITVTGDQKCRAVEIDPDL